jgi:hypothetical protein
MKGPSQREVVIASFINLPKIMVLISFELSLPHYRHLEW